MEGYRFANWEPIMPTATSRRAKPTPAALAHRAALCKELLDLERSSTAADARRKAIEKELKSIATTAGESFRETIAKLGSVTVAPGKDAEYKGEVPQIQTEAWLALKASERKTFEKSGLVKMVSEWGSKFYGKVTIDLNA
jgi:hypothetical protein